MRTKCILLLAGTRPEAIKLAPLVLRLRKSPCFKTVFATTGQHLELLEQALNPFDLTPDIEIKVMTQDQSLSSLSARLLIGLENIFKEVSPDLLLVQGDTTTAFIGGLAAYYHRVRLGHVEAGLRSHDPYSPFPEENNRRLLTRLAHYHFAPTNYAKKNLLKEDIAEHSVFVTGNTGIDALKLVLSQGPLSDKSPTNDSKTILLTMHRRENFGTPMHNIFSAVRTFLETHSDFNIVFPVHPNPNVQKIAQQYFDGIRNTRLIAPVSYDEMVRLLQSSFFVISDSGGIQEESPSLGKPLLILRDTTERPEGILAGNSLLVGTDQQKVRQALMALAEPNSVLYRQMAIPKPVYGDGSASDRIVKVLESKLHDWSLESPPKKEILPVALEREGLAEHTTGELWLQQEIPGPLARE